ncbi:hypothetical protein [Hyphomicrobium sp.]|jgi:hypothetical protein|uniref:hypothetical protein n=1 Tax=Hyphomicrobium sp. TaxID=82 RepID=UPI003561B434
MSGHTSLGLLRNARLTRRQLISFALASAVLNGIITAGVGAWLGQTYAKYQSRKQSIEALVHLIYERRTRAGMVASALRRGADIEEVRYRKRAYDETYVDWNKNVMQNIFAIREVTGEYMISGLEKYYEDGLVAAMSDVDRCLTKAYDTRIANGDPNAELDKCHMAENHQFVLDCGATFTNELYKLTKLSFIPIQTKGGIEGRERSEVRIKSACTRPEVMTPGMLPSSSPEARAEAPPATQSSPKAEPAEPPSAALQTSKQLPHAH